MKPLLALLLATALGLTACADDEPAGRRPALPGPTAPTSSAPAPTPGLADIVDDPEARIVAATVRRSDPSVRSVVWSLCRTPRCYRADEVVAVTDDGFATRHLHALPRQTVETALDGVFLLTRRRESEILQPDGSLTSVDWDALAPGPLRRSEQAVGVHHHPSVHAVDTTTGAAHLVPTPAGARGLRSDGPGRLRLLVEAPGGLRLLTSYDGGRSWNEPAPFVVPRGALAGMIGSSTTAGALVTGGDGATLLPLGGLHMENGEGWRSFPGFDEPMAYQGNGGGAVMPDGRLLLSVESWSDSHRNRTSRRPAGLWTSNGEDWSDLRPVPMGAPFEALDLRRDLSPVLDIAVAPGKVTVYAVHDSPAGRTLWSSTDAGRTWTEVAAR